jgi:2,4-dienoyl-CoA reductase (NADPH2)
MGSEGYLINQFLVERTNRRTDEWGGSYQNRMRLPVEIVRRARKAVGEKFIIIYRLSMLDLVEDGSSWEQIVELAHAIEDAGASIINTGIGWHEARIPTIATAVPRGAFTWVTKKMKSHVSIPLCTTNRINSPSTAEAVLASGSADMVSMARPFLADPLFMKKAYEGREQEINTCIGCNQACLDHTFVGKRASCLVNPQAAHETSLIISPTTKPMNIAVVGAGPAGLACATTAARRGHHVTLYEKDDKLGGQFNMAKLIPGKEEFYETLRYFDQQLKLTKVQTKFNTTFSEADAAAYDAVVVATGVFPRQVNIPNTSSKVKVYSYVDVLRNMLPVGKSVAVIGAGGIGFDVSEFLTHIEDTAHPSSDGLPKPIDNSLIQSFLNEWSVDTNISRGGLAPPASSSAISTPRKIYLLQRKKGKLGSTLGKTTGWIHRATLKKRQVEEISGCSYKEITDAGLVIQVNDKTMTLPVDTVVICAGQESLRTLFDSLKKSENKKVFVIGGAEAAGELDAKRAIDQGTRLAADIENAKTGDVFMAEEDLKYRLMKAMQKYMKK